MAAVTRAELKTMLRALLSTLSAGRNSHTPEEIDDAVELILTPTSWSSGYTGDVEIHEGASVLQFEFVDGILVDLVSAE